jgi:predicted amidophosphoribosyltransferase
MGSVWTALRPWLFPVWCLACDRPGTALCASCAEAASSPFVTAAFGLEVQATAAYAGPIAAAIVALKRGERAYLDPLAGRLAALVRPGAVLVPAVTVRRRAAERGFDQACVLAQRAARLAGATYADVLVKHGGAQRGLGRRGRLAAHGRFAVRAGVPMPSHATLVDDVMTTGATLRDAAAALAAAGCKVDRAVVIAAVPGETSGTAAESRGT